jgi:hypothetical protein
MTLGCPEGFLNLQEFLFLEIWGIAIICVEYITYTFGLHFFFSDAYDSHVCSFDVVAQFLQVTFGALESFISKFFCCFFKSILSSNPEILSSICSILLEWISNVFSYLT